MNKSQAKAKLSVNLKVADGTLGEKVIGLILEVATNFVEQVAQNMIDKGMIYKGNININVNKSNSVEIEIPRYLDYVDKGVNGTERNVGSPYSRGSLLPPLDEVREFMSERGIPIENGSDYAMQLSWHRKGMKPQNIFGTLLENLYKAIKDFLLDNLQETLVKELNLMVEQYRTK